MDGHRFDALAKGLAGARSRRGVLKGLGAAALGALGLERLEGSGVEAKGSNRACAQFCADAFGAGAYAAFQCTNDGARRRGLCYQCGPGNPSSGMMFCGAACIPACTASDQCHVAGMCDPSTGACANPPAQAGTPCNDGDLCTTNDACDGAGNCAGTAVVCSADNATAACNSSTGNCEFTCDAGFADCDGNAANGCEVNLLTDPDNCGACLNACPAPANGTATCVNGYCGVTCNPGFGGPNCQASSITVTSAPADDPNYPNFCDVFVTLTNFEPLTTYSGTFVIRGYGAQHAVGPFMTDNSGNAGPQGSLVAIIKQGQQIDVSIGNVSSGYIPITCPA